KKKRKNPFQKKKVMLYVFIGTKYDLFDGLPDMYKQQSRKFAQKIHAPLVYCSSVKSINVDIIFQIIKVEEIYFKIQSSSGINFFKKYLFTRIEIVLSKNIFFFEKENFVC
ncbi:hypothetical protein RFI_21934, partial [Reticulomyxa filosa]